VRFGALPTEFKKEGFGLFNRRIIIPLVLLVCLAGVLFVINMFNGNPISKMKAQEQALQYYQSTYHRNFVVYAAEYNPKIPAYVFVIGPADNQKIKFDTGLFVQGLTDEYGGILGDKSVKKSLPAGHLPAR